MSVEFITLFPTNYLHYDALRYHDMESKWHKTTTQTSIGATTLDRRTILAEITCSSTSRGGR
jgi:hypothetical protein